MFRYDADGHTILNGVSLRARPGEFIAIVGSSGAGKSSLLRLMLGFERPASGSVLFEQHSPNADGNAHVCGRERHVAIGRPAPASAHRACGGEATAADPVR
ncbi:ATP-binding cassette domain-containing protein [Reyranella sp.]|uniref:ATP-binding cassette domain-containing protein n=1 Tax=Reyranella sp. TaxID=1929291 RepID=UPI003BAAC9CA